MSQPASDATADAYRRKVYAKLMIFVILMLIVWLQPKVTAWLENRQAGGTGGSDVVANHDSASADTTQVPSGRSKVVIKDVDEPVVAEVDRTDAELTSGKPSTTGAGTSSSKAETKVAGTDPPKSDAKKNSGSGTIRMDREDVSKRRTAGGEPTTSKDSTVTPPKTVATSADKSRKDTPALGELREIRDYVFESTAGLLYVKGSADGHRLKHVMQHAKDDLSKPKHGVFEGDRDQILAVIDEAYEKTKKGGKDVRKNDQGGRTVFIVNLGRKIGYVGGSSGERAGNPDCRYVQLVLEDENVVITAYPTKSF